MVRTVGCRSCWISTRFGKASYAGKTSNEAPLSYSFRTLVCNAPGESTLARVVGESAAGEQAGEADGIASLRGRSCCTARRRTDGMSLRPRSRTRPLFAMGRSTWSRCRRSPPCARSARSARSGRRARRRSCGPRSSRPYDRRSGIARWRGVPYPARAHWDRSRWTAPRARCASRRTCHCGFRTRAPRTADRSCRARRATTTRHCATHATT